MIDHASLCLTGGAVIYTATMALVVAIDPAIANIIGVCVGALVAIAIPWIAYKTAALGKKVDEQKITSDLTLQKTAVIEGHVNSEKTAANGKITALEKEISLLREMMEEKKVTAALLAQSAATSPANIIAPVSTAPIPVISTGQTPASDA